MVRSQLLCTFSDINSYESTISQISKHYNLINSRIYVLQDVNDSNSIFLTYNIEFNPNIKSFNGTISFHRIKDHNVLYTINSLNALVRKENNGVEDKNFKIDWSKFKNSLILTRDNDVKIISTKLMKIWNIK